MSSEKEGDSLESVEGLLKKHEDFQKSLAAQEEKFKVDYISHNYYHYFTKSSLQKKIGNQ